MIWWVVLVIMLSIHAVYLYTRIDHLTILYSDLHKKIHDNWDDTDELRVRVVKMEGKVWKL